MFFAKKKTKTKFLFSTLAIISMRANINQKCWNGARLYLIFFFLKKEKPKREKKKNKLDQFVKDLWNDKNNLSGTIYLFIF